MLLLPFSYVVVISWFFFYFFLFIEEVQTRRPADHVLHSRFFTPPLWTEARLYIFLVLFQNYDMLWSHTFSSIQINKSYATNLCDKSTTFWVKTNCFNVLIIDVIKNQNRHRLEIKNNAVCDVIGVLQRQLPIRNKITWLSFCNLCLYVFF